MCPSKRVNLPETLRDLPGLSRTALRTSEKFPRHFPGTSMTRFSGQSRGFLDLPQTPRMSPDLRRSKRTSPEIKLSAWES